MLAIGIPAYRLPREVIEREYRRIEALGVEIRLDTTIGSNGDYSLDDLFKAGYKAVCLAVGAHKSLTLGIPGEELRGVIGGLELLKTINLSQRGDKDAYKAALKDLLPRAGRTRAVVLGGGNTALDVARTLRRVGVENVCVVYRRTRAEMPALPEEIDDTVQEGIPIVFLTAPTRIIGDPRSAVTGLACIRMKLGEPDDGGRRRPVPINGSEFKMPADFPDAKSVVVVAAYAKNMQANFHLDGESYRIVIAFQYYREDLDSEKLKDVVRKEIGQVVPGHHRAGVHAPLHDDVALRR